MRIKSEKGEAERFVGLPDGIMQDIRDYTKYYRLQTDPTALFTGLKGRIGYQRVEVRIKKLGTLAGLPWIHAHTLRHFFATTAIRGRFGSDLKDIRVVQTLLGHRSLKSTQRYTHLTSQEAMEAHKKGLEKFFRGGKKTMILLEKNEPVWYCSGADRVRMINGLSTHLYTHFNSLIHAWKEIFKTLGE